MTSELEKPRVRFGPPPNFRFTREEYWKKLTNLEKVVLRIRAHKSPLMSEICSSEEEKSARKTSSVTVTILPDNAEFICHECKTNERTAFQLCEHMAIYHSPTEKREWRCYYCNTQFGRRGGLRRHVQMVHMQMMHKCPVENCTHPGYKCTKALSAHMKTHSQNEVVDIDVQDISSIPSI